MHKVTWLFIRLLVPTALIFALFGFPNSARAFRGGYHAELTQECLVREGFGRNSIQMVQISNINSDIYSDIPGHDRSARESDPASRTRWFNDIYIAAAQYLHFGYLTGYAEIQAEWNRLQANTYLAVYQAEHANDVEGFLAALGTSLHVVQDFYAHSNWADLDWEGDASWFDIPPEQIQAGPEVYTFNGGIPGREHDTMNKDYATRRNYEIAYREAYYASCQWIQRVKTWVSPDFWQEAMTYDDYNFAEDEKETRQLIWYSGTWKEPHVPGLTWEGCFVGALCEWDGSGEDVIFAVASWVNGDYVSDKWEDYAILIASPPRGLAVPPGGFVFTPRQVWVMIDTDRVRQTDAWWELEDIDPGDDADFYAKIWATSVNVGSNQTINRDTDRLYIETMYEGYDDLSPNWLTLIPFEPPDQEADYIGFEYGIWDDDGIGLSMRGQDDVCDINPQGGKRSKFFGFFPMSPNFNADNPIIIETQGGGGDDDDAAARIIVTYTQPQRTVEEDEIVSIDPDLLQPPIGDLADVLKNIDLQPPDGFIDGINCQEINGWAWDPKTTDQPITVEVYELRGSTEVLLGSTLADLPRQDLVTALGDHGRHGFSIPTYSILKDGQEHGIKVYALNSNPGFPNVMLSPSSSSVPAVLVCEQAQPEPSTIAQPTEIQPEPTVAVQPTQVLPEPVATDKPVDIQTAPLVPTATQEAGPSLGLRCFSAAFPLAIGAATFLGRHGRTKKRPEDSASQNRDQPGNRSGSSHKINRL
ncbi:MAG: hypothetical protein ACM3H7_08755 [Acidobacteriaceae bacterium]